MARQYRGCSHLYYAIATETSEGITFGTVKQLAPVKAVSRDVASDNEKVYADNVVQQVTYGATSITRTFDTTRIEAAVAAELLGNTAITIGDLKAYATKADGSARPYVAIGYALHDGNIDKPVELVWSYLNKINSISKTANTIDDGTGSEGQSVEATSVAPKIAWTTTGERNLDFVLAIPDDATAAEAAELITAFFAQVVTPDNAAEVLTPEEPAEQTNTTTNP